MRRLTLGLSLCALALLTTSLFAAGPLAAHAQEGGDIVRMADGSFVRGTIVERAEGSRIVIRTLTGELRVVPMQIVAYAGPDAVGETSASRARTGVSLEVRARHPGLFLHRQSAEVSGSVWSYRGAGYAHLRAFEPMCGAPCTLVLEPGSYLLGVAQGGGAAVAAHEGPLRIETPTRVELDFDDRSAIRVVGWLVFALSAAACLVTVAAPLITGDLQNWELPLALGVGIFAAGSAIGIPLLAWQDSGYVRVLGQR